MLKKLVERPSWEDLNHTELVQLAKRIGLTGATRAVPREELTQSLDAFEPLYRGDPLGTYKDRYILWVRAHWDRVGMQMPKGSFCPQCHLCSDFQFSDCWLKNGHRVA